MAIFHYKKLLKTALVLVLSLCVPLTAVACPNVGRFIDYNCDEALRITITGDSIVRGVGDIIYRGEGGYAYRLKEHLPEAKIMNLGFPGIKSSFLYRAYVKAFETKRGDIYKRTRNLDVIIIDVGRNDYWLRYTPAKTVRSIQRLVALLKKELTVDGVTPYILVAKMVHSARSYQQPFIDAVNLGIERLADSGKIQTYLDFSTLRAPILPDGIHPNHDGYIMMARYVNRWFVRTSEAFFRANRPDTDSDGIYDLFEDGHKFTCDSHDVDTDHDGHIDGEEVFSLRTNPLDPLDPPAPTPTATPTASPTATATPTP